MKKKQIMKKIPNLKGRAPKLIVMGLKQSTPITGYIGIPVATVHTFPNNY